MAKLLPGYSKKQKLLKESVENNGKDIYLSGIFQVFDEENENGRVYSREVLLPEVERYKKEFVETNRAFGELDHPEDRASISGDRVCHRIVDLWIEGKNVMGKTLVLDTTLGKEVKAMLQGGGILGVSSRSLGDTDYNNNVTDLYLLCWDVVQEPSVSAALMKTLNESKEYDISLYRDAKRKIFKDITTNRHLSEEDIKREQTKVLNELRKIMVKSK